MQPEFSWELLGKKHPLHWVAKQGMVSHLCYLMETASLRMKPA